MKHVDNWRTFYIGLYNYLLLTKRSANKKCYRTTDRFAYTFLTTVVFTGRHNRLLCLHGDTIGFQCVGVYVQIWNINRSFYVGCLGLGVCVCVTIRSLLHVWVDRCPGITIISDMGIIVLNMILNMIVKNVIFRDCRVWQLWDSSGKRCGLMIRGVASSKLVRTSELGLASVRK